jgi:hypothetical protein
MTKEQFNILNNSILENLKSKNPFSVTTTELFSWINFDIKLKSGHTKLYDEFIKYCNELTPPYSVNSFYKHSENDRQFDIEFRLK